MFGVIFIFTIISIMKPLFVEQYYVSKVLHFLLNTILPVKLPQLAEVGDRFSVMRYYKYCYNNLAFGTVFSSFICLIPRYAHSVKLFIVIMICRCWRCSNIQLRSHSFNFSLVQLFLYLCGFLVYTKDRKSILHRFVILVNNFDTTILVLRSNCWLLRIPRLWQYSR